MKRRNPLTKMSDGEMVARAILKLAEVLHNEMIINRHPDIELDDASDAALDAELELRVKEREFEVTQEKRHGG